MLGSWHSHWYETVPNHGWKTGYDWIRLDKYGYLVWFRCFGLIRGNLENPTFKVKTCRPEIDDVSLEFGGWTMVEPWLSMTIICHFKESFKGARMNVQDDLIPRMGGHPMTPVDPRGLLRWLVDGLDFTTCHNQSSWSSPQATDL